jgi:hypothetical protein
MPKHHEKKKNIKKNKVSKRLKKSLEIKEDLPLRLYNVGGLINEQQPFNNYKNVNLNKNRLRLF